MAKRFLSLALLIVILLMPSYALASEGGTAISADVSGQYSIRLDIGEGGSVTIGKKSYVGTATITVKRLGKLRVGIVPNAGYELDAVLYNGEGLTSKVKDGRLTINGISSNGELVVRYKKDGAADWTAGVSGGRFS